MSADFAGETARLYARFRRDLPADQAAELAGQLGLAVATLAAAVAVGDGAWVAHEVQGVDVPGEGKVVVDGDPAQLGEHVGGSSASSVPSSPSPPPGGANASRVAGGPLSPR